MCEAESLQSVQAMTLEAKAKCHWLIAGLICACIGSMLYLIILGADLGSVYSSQTHDMNKSDGYVFSTNSNHFVNETVKDTRFDIPLTIVICCRKNVVDDVDFVLPSHPPTLTPGSTQIRSRSQV